MNLTLRHLRESGLSVDWMTVEVGYEGFEVGWRNWSLRRDEIPEYALDVLATTVGTPDEYLVFQLADADPTNRMAFNQPLMLLAERSGVMHETALRKWRYAAVHEFVRTFQPPGDADDYDCGYWDEYYAISELKSDWNGVVSIHPIPEVAKGDTEDAIGVEIALLRAWLLEECTKLL